MNGSVLRRGALLLPLLGVFALGGTVPEVQARGDDRRYDRHAKHYQHYPHKHMKQRQHYYRHAPKQRVVVVERHHYHRPPAYYAVPGPGTHISVSLPLGTIVSSLPGGFISFSYSDGPYYYQGGNYYRPYDRGYRVVSAPPGHRW
ncbi:DUF6515 family protein [Zobellella sp. DQSA1]|uniref:DUF6515 family protein n=1 Tax=Zobellella sp. DQSA1 TaxID=3342386 RepID=UPI0035BF0FAC